MMKRTAPTSREIRRVTRKRRLTPREAGTYRRIREQVESEKQEMLAWARRKIAALESLDDVFRQLRESREQRGLSLADMRKLTGMDRASISKLEGGRRGNCTVQTLVRYAHAVGKKLVVSLVDEPAAQMRQ
jgi:ribosome-binding protein aMBF1 (putative translation factor)